ncbi:hypothetical protein [Syntrophus aciditrophicus]|uniref:Hypothetical cytosolic protein n=1 Tax=Syntrophus aciditrophicus (strain SB) TaxID=56780 RepID=Q2LW58_SYNAS|nr:hypothetical protein [Syntrophus aciditrophicus]ABC78315.1 hypothetical cytosolic protein [Syntrophus aciditrophicus SB]
MISKGIRCTCCGYEGLSKSMGPESAEFQPDVPREQRLDPYSEKLHFRCPQCGFLVAVKLTSFLAADTMNEFPVFPETLDTRLMKTRNLMSVWGDDFIDPV